MKNIRVIALIAAAGLMLTSCGEKEENNRHTTVPTIAAPATTTPDIQPAAADPEITQAATWDSLLTFAINKAKASERFTNSSHIVIDLPSSGKGTDEDPVHVSVEVNGEQIAVYDYGVKAPVRVVAFYTLEGQGRKTTYLKDQIPEDLREQSTSYSDSPEMAKSRHQEAQKLFDKLISRVSPSTP